MEAALRQNISFDIITKIKTMSDSFKISKIEEMISDCLEKMPNETPINYIGELNKNDIMH